MSEIIPSTGSDIGTMWLASMRDNDKGDIVYTSVRDCYRILNFEEEFEDQMKEQGSHYIREGNKLYIIGNEAYIQSSMAEFGSETDALQRPMKDGILNPDSPKISLMILRELIKACVENKVGPARKDEILYFSVPGNPIDSNINNSFHTKMCQQFLTGLGYDSRPLNESLAVLFSENPKMHCPEGDIPFTGLAMSFGAGQINVCLAERGVPIKGMEFSICKAGDYIDINAARMTGEPRTKVLRTKEKKLNFNSIDDSDPIVLALECYYEEMLNYVFNQISTKFSGNKGSLEHPIDLVVSGGTASVPGMDKKIKTMLAKIELPFEIAEVRLAGGGDRTKMLGAVARGCYLRAKQAAKKMANTKDALDKVS